MRTRNIMELMVSTSTTSLTSIRSVHRFPFETPADAFAYYWKDLKLRSQESLIIVSDVVFHPHPVDALPPIPTFT